MDRRELLAYLLWRSSATPQPYRHNRATPPRLFVIFPLSAFFSPLFHYLNFVADLAMIYQRNQSNEIWFLRDFVVLSRRRCVINRNCVRDLLNLSGFVF